VSLMLNNRSYLEKLDGQALVTLVEGNRTNVHFNRNVRPLQTCLKNHKRKATYNEKLAAASIGPFNSAPVFFLRTCDPSRTYCNPIEEAKILRNYTSNKACRDILNLYQKTSKLKFVKSHSHLWMCLKFGASSE